MNTTNYPAPKFNVGDMIFTTDAGGNKPLVKVAWDESANGYTGAWRYYAVGFNTLYPYAPKGV